MKTPLPRCFALVPLIFLLCMTFATGSSATELLQGKSESEISFERIKYNNPGLKVDLGVGLWAWPLPMDFDSDGDLDLVVSCPDKPYNGTYFFENPTGEKFPTFKPGRRIGPAIRNGQVSYVGKQPRILSTNSELTNITEIDSWKFNKIFPQSNIHPGKVRANQWKYADLNGDGALDLIVGVGDWKAYGWDNAYNNQGEWTNGPLHGYVYFLKNTGSNEMPKYDSPSNLQAAGKPLDVYGMPSPNLADFDHDGDLDLLCGEFLDGFTYFENIGTKTKPKFAKGRKVHDSNNHLVAMDLQMITPVVIDWTGDGWHDLIVGDEDGRVALVENTGKLESGVPVFHQPVYFQQEAADVKFGALVTPVSFDWDGDGDEDLICGNTAGYIGFIENLDGGNPPKWDKPKYLKAGNEIVRVQAGKNGSIQGPCEAKWGYTTISIADWNHDGLPDIIGNSIWGKVVWWENIGSRPAPQLAKAKPVTIDWHDSPQKPVWNWFDANGDEFVTQWRTTPLAIDWNKDKLTDLVMLDHEGYLAYFERKMMATGTHLTPGQRIFMLQNSSDSERTPLQLNAGIAGRSGRRKLAFVDWNGDGKLDLLANSVNADLYLQISSENGNVVFAKPKTISKQRLAGHTTSPTTVDWNGNGKPELLLGAEDGFLYWSGPR